MTQIFSIFVKFANIFDTLDENWLNYLTLYPLFWISSIYRIKAPTSQEEWGGVENMIKKTVFRWEEIYKKSYFQVRLRFEKSTTFLRP